MLSRFLLINSNDPKYLRDIILNFVLAGKDPIAITMLWFIYELCKHPEVQDRVAKEIKEAINMKEEITNVAEFAARVTEATFENMQYLQAALTETVRLYPALPVVRATNHPSFTLVIFFIFWFLMTSLLDAVLLHFMFILFGILFLSILCI